MCHVGTKDAAGILVAITVCLALSSLQGRMGHRITPAMHPLGFIFGEVVRTTQNRVTGSKGQPVPVCVSSILELGQQISMELTSQLSGLLAKNLGSSFLRIEGRDVLAPGHHRVGRRRSWCPYSIPTEALGGSLRIWTGTSRQGLPEMLFVGSYFLLLTLTSSTSFPAQKEPRGGCNFHVTSLHTAHSTPFNLLPHRHLLLPTTQKARSFVRALTASCPPPLHQGRASEMGN